MGSTALKAALPGSDITARNRAYFETILTPYRQRVEADLAVFGGRVVKTSGDDYFLVFASAAQAAQWAAAIQARQSAEAITTPLGPLQVRIGMHTGAPLPDPDDMANVAMANPSLGTRFLGTDYLAMEAGSLSLEGRCRERLGVFDEVVGSEPPVIPAAPSFRKAYTPGRSMRW